MLLLDRQRGNAIGNESFIDMYINMGHYHPASVVFTWLIRKRDEMNRG